MDHNITKTGIWTGGPWEGFDVATLQKGNLQINPNLLPHTSIEYGLGYFVPYASGTVTWSNEQMYNGHNTMKVTPSSSNTSSGATSNYNNNSAILVNGQTYTYSCMIYSTLADHFDTSSLGHFQTEAGGNAHNRTIIANPCNIPANKWTRVYITFKPTANNTIFRSFFIYFGSTSQIIYVTEIKLEVGDKVTPWVPHINDTYGLVDNGNLMLPIEANQFYEY